MNKKNKVFLLALLGIVPAIAFIFWGYWYTEKQVPNPKLQTAVQKKQEELNKMVRSGDVVSVSQEEFVLRVKKSGQPDLLGKEITFFADKNTIVQKGNVIIYPSQDNINKSLVLSDFIKVNTFVDVIAMDLPGSDRSVKGRALAIHFLDPNNKNQ